MPLLSPAFRRSHFHRQVPVRPQRRERSYQRKVEMWARNCPVILPKFRLPLKFRDLLHAANLRHGTEGFTSPPKEGVLKIFFALKIRRLRPGLNPRTWVLKASMLPLEHRSRFYCYIFKKKTSLVFKSNTFLVFFSDGGDRLPKHVALKFIYISYIFVICENCWFLIGSRIS